MIKEICVPYENLTVDNKGGVRRRRREDRVGAGEGRRRRRRRRKRREEAEMVIGNSDQGDLRSQRES